MKAHDNFVDFFKDAETLKFTMMQCLFLGPPKVGKSSLLRRLAHLEPPTSNTGAMDSSIKIIIEDVKSFTVEIQRQHDCTPGSIKHEWRHVTYDVDTVQLLKAFIKARVTGKDTKEVQQNKEAQQNIKPQEVKETHENEEVQQGDNKKVSHSTTSMEQSREQTSSQEIFKKALKTGNWNCAKEMLESSWTVYLTDSGGQPEFQEVLPALVSGPTIFFVVFSLKGGVESLNKQYVVKYQKPGSEDIMEYTSQYTVKEALYSMLSCIASTSKYASDCRDHFRAQTKVILIGTHKDTLGDPDKQKEEIDKIEEKLQEMLLKTSWFKEGTLVTISRRPQRLMIAVNNDVKTTDDKDLEEIHKVIERLGNGDFKAELPPTWLALDIAIRGQESPFLSLTQCEILADECGITHEELTEKKVLRYLSRLGTIRYFDETDLRDIVICNPQALYDAVTELIAETFVLDRGVHDEVITVFEEHGIFPKKFVTDSLMESSTSKKLPMDWILNLLKHLCMIAEFQSDGEEKCFMPCVLRSAEKSPNIKQSNTVTPLVVLFDSGYVPMGMFSALAVYLMQWPPKDLPGELQKIKLKWKLLEKSIHKGSFTIKVEPEGDHFIFKCLQFAGSQSYIKIFTEEKMKQQQRRITLNMICMDMRTIIKHSVSAVSSIHKCSQKFFFAFECNFCEDCSGHLAKVIDTTRLECQSANREYLRESLDSRPQENIWFSDISLSQPVSKMFVHCISH